MYRADLYVTARIREFDIDEHSRKLFSMLTNIPELENLSKTKMSGGKEDWYDIIGSINVLEGARAFETICKEASSEEDYNVFMRIDRNMTAESYEEAQLKAKEWVHRTITQFLTENFSTVWVRIETPLERRRLKLGER